MRHSPNGPQRKQEKELKEKSVMSKVAIQGSA
jgi:hypothetical protein